VDVSRLSTRQLDEIVGDRGLCRGMDTDDWYPLVNHPVGGVSVKTAEAERQYAARQCAGCPVAGECLELGLRIPAGTYGIWGGTSERDRLVMRKRRADEGAVA
jgi:WhiB family redox-sensing transcriptional regulator